MIIFMNNTMFMNNTIWKRYIDDVFGVWSGSERQFHIFVKTLNQLQVYAPQYIGDPQNIGFQKMVCKMIGLSLMTYSFISIT